MTEASFWEQKDGDPSRIYTERPKRLIQGRAMQIQPTTESVIQIHEWLKSHGITSYIAPAGNSNPILRLETANQYLDNETGFPGDWVYLDVEGNANIVKDASFRRQFKQGFPGNWASDSLENNKENN